MQVSSSTASIQLLKAQQAWEARRMRQTAQPTVNSTIDSSDTQPNVPESTRLSPNSSEGLTTTNPTSVPATQWNQTVREVQSIAQNAGYVGVTEQDIHRAYTLGESLLADYRV